MSQQQIHYTPQRLRGPRRELHIRRAARDRYAIDETLFSIQGHVLFSGVQTARKLVLSLRQTNSATTVGSSDLYAMGLIDEIFHYLIGVYREQFGDAVFTDLYRFVEAQIGHDALEYALRRFSHLFPTVAQFRGTETVEQTLDRTVDGISGRDVALEELLVIWLANRNPAYRHAAELFSEEELEIETQYAQIVTAAAAFFARQPTLAEDEGDFLAMLRQPAIQHPDSLHDQLEYIRRRWGTLIGEFLTRLLRSLDALVEEHKPRFFGPGQSAVYTFGDYAGFDDQARYSPDSAWMPRVVIIAKSTLVWLDQLSKRYGYPIQRLDQIPDEELDSLAAAGFTGLWLIGLWQRSDASKQIKQMCGNPDAEASAYSLYDYEIADELGGWGALEKLRQRLWQRGLRVASDMVPNHTGIDSRWVHLHPDWYVQLPYSPFPGYSFNGANLSSVPDVGIYLEDHYYNRSDAAVVFKRVHFPSGDTRYIYHGNDGTTMPWNDTAQINYLNPDAREAIIQTILHVARNFPIIRFDAAMTLAKQHIQRLWFPPPGQGGDIPSRSEHGLTPADFECAIPIEFWREVVDRVAAEVPDTLLLAEAFWMMESYFVRNLGMHRVYNSAFMNMLKNEDNDKYRQAIKNTLEYDPEILKRFVNFMNNPDEETAVAQFGKDDKYFGVCTLMVTLPGLPMFGHGQVEGFGEKYGMEYRRAYWDETPDQALIERHRREVFPLMHRRALFADAAHFRLYDLFTEHGEVNQNVYAYTNSMGHERALVLYNNSYYETSGWIQGSAPYNGTNYGRDGLHRERFAAALGLHQSYRHFLILQEQRSGLWFIRNSAELHERGIFVHLRGYVSQVYLNMYEVADTAHAHYARLADQLHGAGTPDIDRALKRLMLQPLYDAFGVVANSAVLRQLISAACAKLPERLRFAPRDGCAEVTPLDWARFETDYRGFLQIAASFCAQPTDVEAGVDQFRRYRQGLLALIEQVDHSATSDSLPLAALETHLTAELEDQSVFAALLLLIPLDHFLSMDTATAAEDAPARISGFDALDQAGEWMLISELRTVMEKLQAEHPLPSEWEEQVQVLLAYHRWAASPHATAALFGEDRVQQFLLVHEYDQVRWFNRERFEQLVDWLYTVGVWQQLSEMDPPLADQTTILERTHRLYQHWRRAEEKAAYRFDAFQAAMAAPAGVSAPAAVSAPAGVSAPAVAPGDDNV